MTEAELAEAILNWRPLPEVTDGVVDADHARALHRLLGAAGAEPRTGSPLPLLWQWLTFLPRVGQAELGADGHVSSQPFHPPFGPPRRMFGGGRAQQFEPVQIGESLKRRRTLKKATWKAARSGRLLIVTLRDEISTSGGELAIVEEQDVVYRGAAESTPRDASSSTKTPQSGKAVVDWAVERQLSVVPTLLFRFSALTYNAHRIHYDRDYARNVEGYPGLVVHGPLQALAMAEIAKTGMAPARNLSWFEFKAISPAFDDGSPLRVVGRPAGDRWELATLDASGTVCCRAKAGTAAAGSALERHLPGETP